ncbi:CAMK family protein kinase [Tritrichomonas foetus]|uniref:CAMK family protein kinase n=1 Tax=Tritrichomonas foetus TaxID=1144522 RepID=A0A1J4JRB0_9EUKA|nr:CAMK family protein kinase [Tritrichomonas foetus]|eukprot:OHT01649.1 CAMK family protein kinase [Tritrichomonas foetus]
MITDFYVDWSEIGRGSFGSVYRAFEKRTHHQVAIKVIDKSNNATLERTRKVLPVCLKLDHPFVVHYFEYFEDEAKIYIVMEYVPSGTLLSFINASRRLNELQIKVYALQILEILDYLHTDMKMVHRDLKTENFLIDKYGNLRLTDFGFSKLFENDKKVTQTLCGSPLYAAPEIIMNSEYNSSADIWSAGVIIYGMAYGELPFDSKSISQSFQQVVLKEPRYNDTSVNPQLNDLIRQMLIKSPQNRITLKNIRSHPFMIQYKIPRLQMINTNELYQIVLFQMVKLKFIEADVVKAVTNQKVCHESAVYKILSNDRLHLELNKIKDMPHVPLTSILPKTTKLALAPSVKAGTTSLRASRAATIATRSSPAVLKGLLLSGNMSPIRHLRNPTEPSGGILSNNVCAQNSVQGTLHDSFQNAFNDSFQNVTPNTSGKMPQLRRRTRGATLSIKMTNQDGKSLILPSVSPK